MTTTTTTTTITTTNNILDAFIKQTYGSIHNAQLADKLADKNPNAQPEPEHEHEHEHEQDNRFPDNHNQNLEKEADDKLKTQLGARILMTKEIKDSMNIPTKLTPNELNNHPHPHPHPNFKNYDHSLEEHRGHKLGLIKLKDIPSGSVAEMVNNMFDDNSNLVE